jgi:hypothetical protein
MTGIDGRRAPAWESAIDVRVDQAHSARVIDALRGGKTNFAADRELAGRIQQVFPFAPIALAASRLFLRRAVGRLTALGLSQFLDLGAGRPHGRSLHEIVRPGRGDARVVYPDHDPIVIAHLEALLAAEPPETVGILHADVTEPEQLLAAIAAQGVVDLTRPLALVMGAILDHLPPDAGPDRLISALAAHLAPGSALVLTHAASDLTDGMALVASACREAGIDFHPRSRPEVKALFTGWELVAPGVIPASRWRTQGPCEPDANAPVYAGVAVLPGGPR